MIYRDIPARGFARFARVLMLAAFAVTGGSVVGFLVVLFTAIAGGELDPVAWSGDVDAMLRQSIGAAALSIGASLGVGAFAQGAYRMLFVRQLARAAEADPRRVVAWNTRRLLILPTPFLGTYIYGFYFLVMGIIAIIINALVVSTGESDVAATILIIEVALWLLMAAFLLLVWRVGEPAWKRADDRVSEAWGLGGRLPMRMRQPRGKQRTDGDARALRRAARRIAIVGAVAGVVGAGTFMIAVSLRQPCRRCDQRSYAEPGERVIDALVAFAIPFTTVAVLAAVLALVAIWLSGVLEASGASSLAQARSDAPEHEVLDRLFNGWWPGTTAGLAMVGLGWGFAPVLAGADLAAPGILPPALIPTLIGVGAVGIALIWWSEGAAARSRNRLREAWALGDIVTQPTPAGRNRRRAAR